MNAVKPLFPWYGGKSTVAETVWQRLGDVTNYVEPFFGSGAVLFARPRIGAIETVNDKDRFVANFWRAAQHDPEAVASWLDWPVNEADLASRHYWLITQGAARIARCELDPDYFDAQVAGWWCWGLCSWIGSGWCSGEGPWVWDGESDTWIDKNDLGNAGQGNRQCPHLWRGHGINRQLPHLGNAGRGINRKRPHLSAGQGINRKLPHLSAGQGAHLLAMVQAVAERLRNVRVCCGDWSRVCGPSVTIGHGLTGVFLDPPYSAEAGRDMNIYATDCGTVAHDAARWAIEAGRDPLFRIALCGYEGEHTFPPDWDCHAWKAHGGYGHLSDDTDGIGRVNSRRERIWFSPACLPRVQRDLFA